MNSLRNVIFDLDGTLIDSSDGVVDAVNYSLRKLGEPEQPPEKIKAYIGFPLSQMYPVFSSAPVAELYRVFQERARETIVATAVPLDGAEDVIKELVLKFDVRLAIASTKIRPHIDGIVAKLGWQEFFAAIVGGNEVSRVKPDPEAFLLTLQRLGARATETVVVGDTINDILAAQAVPLEAIGVVSPYGNDRELRAARPGHVLNSVGELPAYIGDRLRRRRTAS